MDFRWLCDVPLDCEVIVRDGAAERVFRAHLAVLGSCSEMLQRNLVQWSDAPASGARRISVALPVATHATFGQVYMSV
jgi:hypothetical protein